MSIHAPSNNPRKLPQMRNHSLPFGMQASGDRPDCLSPRPQESEASSAGAQPRLAPHLSEARATLWSEASGGRLDCRTSRPRGIRASCAGALPRFVSRQGDEHIFCFQASGDRPGCRSPRPRGTSRILCRCATLFRLSPGRSKLVFVSKPAGTGLGAGPRVLSFGEANSLFVGRPAWTGRSAAPVPSRPRGARESVSLASQPRVRLRFFSPAGTGRLAGPRI